MIGLITPTNKNKQEPQKDEYGIQPSSKPVENFKSGPIGHTGAPTRFGIKP